MLATVPPDASVVAQFGTVQGPTGMVIQDPRRPGYGLVFPGTTLVPARVVGLEGLTGVRLTDQTAVAGENIMLMEGAGQGCPVRKVLVTVRLPRIQSIGLPVCGPSYSLQPRSDGRSVLIQPATQPAPFFVYDDGRLGRIELARPVRATARRPVPARPQAARPGAAPAAAVPDVDSLPPVTSSVPLNLDQ